MANRNLIGIWERDPAVRTNWGWKRPLPVIQSSGETMIINQSETWRE